MLLTLDRLEALDPIPWQGTAVCCAATDSGPQYLIRWQRTPNSGANRTVVEALKP